MEIICGSLPEGEDCATYFNRLVLSVFSLLIFVLLLYFWQLARRQLKETQKDGAGLIYLAAAFLFHALLGLASVFQQALIVQLTLSTLIYFSYLSALPFFSLGTGRLDQLVARPAWRNGLKYVAFGWILLVVVGSESSWVRPLDLGLSLLAIGLMGFMVTRYFWQRGLRFIALISIGYFLTYLVIQVWQPGHLVGGKFVHLNTVVLGPALVLAVIALAYTFNWLNELNFYELSRIWVNSETQPGQPVSAQAYAQLTQPHEAGDWLKKIANDQLEQVIDELIILKKHRNQPLDTVLNIASRNTRNNNNFLKELIKYEDYQLNRNKVSHALTELVGAK